MMRSAVAFSFVWLLGSALAGRFDSAAAQAPLVPDTTHSACLADRLVQVSGAAKGICCLLSLNQGELALGLAERGDFLIHGWDQRPGQVTAARAAIDRAGRLGKRIMVEHGRPARLPYADDVIDLVVHVNLSPKDLSELSLPEILRVLRPGGKAILGWQRVAGNPARNRLTPGQLTAWLNQSNIVDSPVQENDLAVWALVTKPRPAGEGNWSHWEHGPDNNPVSEDQRIKAPYMTQWLGRPYYITMPSITTAAGGRIFLAMGHIAHHRREEAWLNTILARDAYNGTVLWTRKLPDGYLVHRSAFVATDDVFYMIDTDDRGCLMLDAETGQELGRIEPAEVPGPWKWMALRDGILYALVGGEMDPPETTVVRSTFTHWSWGELSPGYYRKRIPWGFGRTVIAYDLKSHRLVWRYAPTMSIDSRAMVLGDDRIFVYAPDARLVSLDAATGRPVWENDDPKLRALIEQPGRGLGSTPGFRTCSICLFTPKALVYQAQTRMNVVAVSPRDGQLLWHKKKTTNNPNAIFVEDHVLLGVGKGGSTLVVNPETGEVLEDLNFRKRSCARLTATSDSFFCRGWPEGLTRFDRENKKTLFNGAMRPSCNDGVIAANGLLYMGPWSCDCNLSLMGRVVLCSAGSFDFRPVATEEDRLEQTGRACRGESQLETTERDWATYRANNARDASTPVAVADQPVLLWQLDPPTHFQPTPPTTAGGLVFFGGDDGKVRAVDASAGGLKWSFATAGPVLRPPTIYRGRALVGSGDGYIYALDAVDGRLLWRFRAAPTERRIPVYGALSSTWPVHSGVLVQDGVAYAAAGIIDYDGTYVYALDAKTGRIRWQNNSSGHLDPQLRKGISAQGNLTIGGGRLWMAGGNVVSPAAYDLQTGQYVGSSPGDGSPKANRGEEVGIFRDKYVVLGGRLRFSAAQNVVNPGYFTAQAMQSANTTGPPVLLQRGKIPPAWDADRLVAVNGLSTIPRAYAAIEIEKHLRRANNGGRPRDDRPNRLRLPSVWAAQSLAGSDTVSLALCPNAVLAVCQKPRLRDYRSQWLLVALTPKDGSPQWQKALAGPALTGGLAVDAQGRMVVALQDGRIACYGKRDQRPAGKSTSRSDTL